LGVRSAWLIVAIACGPRQPEPALPSTPDAGEADAGFAFDAGVEVEGPVAGEVRILSWNIEAFPKTATTARLVEQILGELRPDIVGVQEISDPAAFEALDDRLEDYRAIQVDDPEDFIRVGLLYRDDRVDLANVFALFEHDGYAFPRAPLSADVTVTSTAGVLFDFTFITVHHKAQSDTESRERRRAANEILHEWMQGHMASRPERDYVIVGDFNDRLDDRPGDNVFEVFLTRPDLYAFLTAESAWRGETSYIPFPGLIDHVLVTTDALTEYGDGETSPVPLEMTVLGYEEHVSDHRPVLSRFRVHRDP
jgi:exonuclease III